MMNFNVACGQIREIVREVVYQGEIMSKLLRHGLVTRSMWNTYASWAAAQHRAFTSFHIDLLDNEQEAKEAWMIAEYGGFEGAIIPAAWEAEWNRFKHGLYEIGSGMDWMTPLGATVLAGHTGLGAPPLLLLPIIKIVASTLATIAVAGASAYAVNRFTEADIVRARAFALVLPNLPPEDQVKVLELMNEAFNEKKWYEKLAEKALVWGGIGVGAYFLWTRVIQPRIEAGWGK